MVALQNHGGRLNTEKVTGLSETEESIQEKVQDNNDHVVNKKKRLYEESREDRKKIECLSRAV